ncbi:MAG: HAD hydrolase family protein [Prevotellaceae bacterium]|jgi:hydroxymethylpyrimidine pyrophosphatase-like HAD family hydrolase|nr:HAD hydrolase family protein [Prevotellaceae bacterium]
MIIAIDFDGTIVENDFPRIGALIPDAKETINRLHDEGHYIIIWTCRHGDKLTEAVNFLSHNHIMFNAVNADNPENTAMYGDTGRKIYAHIYIDDRNAGGLPPWKLIKEEITQREREWLRKNAKA